MNRDTPSSAAWSAKRSRSASGSRAAWPAKSQLGHRLVVDRAGEVGDGLAAAGRDVPLAGDLRLEVVDLGQERLGRTLTRVPLGEQPRGLLAKLGKWVNLEARHRPRDDTVAPMPKTLDRSRARARRRACARLRPLHRRRQQPRLPRVLRAARGARDDRRAADERAARVHEHALQAARRLPAEGRRGRVGLAPGASRGGRRGGGRRLQGGPEADAGPAARAVPALPPDRRGVRLPQPGVRGLGGRRRDRDARDARRRARGSRRASSRPTATPSSSAARTSA